MIVLIAGNFIALIFSGKNRYTSYGPGRIAILLVAPFQNAVTNSIRFVRDIWDHYFFLVSATEENERLKKLLSETVEKTNQCKEIALSNIRLRNLLKFQKAIPNQFLAAEVIGKDPSPWFKTVIINKGKANGIRKGLSVVIPEGIVGQIIDVSNSYSKVLLIIDQNSAVDALVRRTRARGIIKGESKDRCLFNYVLHKREISVGDTVVSSGLDGVFPKGLSIGHVSGIIKRSSGIFQDVMVTPFVDFEKLEEVLVILSPEKQEIVRGR